MSYIISRVTDLIISMLFPDVISHYYYALFLQLDKSTNCNDYCDQKETACGNNYSWEKSL